MVTTALPAIMLFREHHALAPALGALNTIRPAARNQVFPAVLWIGEVEDRFLKCGRFHALSMLEFDGVVKYIFTIVYAIRQGRRAVGYIDATGHIDQSEYTVVIEKAEGIRRSHDLI